jgi:hypothetical protein
MATIRLSLMFLVLRLTFVCLLDDGKDRKSFLCEVLVLPQRWYVGLVEIVGFVDNRALISNCGNNIEREGLEGESYDGGGL